MDNATARVMGGIYIAICAAISREGVEMANDVLLGFADNPNIHPEDRRIYRAIAESVTCDASDEIERPQCRFEVITGGAARDAFGIFSRIYFHEATATNLTNDRADTGAGLDKG